MKVTLADLEHNKKMFYVHRLVGMTFLPNPDNLPEINHINQIKDDNRVENLAWVSSKDNNNFGDRVARMVATRKLNHRLRKAKNDLEKQIILNLDLWKII